MAHSDEKLPGTGIKEGSAAEGAGRNGRIQEGHLAVSEITSDRPAAPSPFGDDITFPLPVESLRYTPTTTP